MNFITDILEEKVKEVAEELKTSPTAREQRASGDWIDSVETRKGTFSVDIWANDYTQWLVQGRAPGKRPPISPLVRWVELKLGATGNEAKGIAFAVANKIAKEGTNYYPEGTDLVDGVLTEARYQRLIDELGQEVSVAIGENLTRQFKQAFA